MVESLQHLLPQKVSTAPADLEAHSKDESYPTHHPPIAVVYAENLPDIQTTLAWAREHRIPVVPFGAGTSLEGQVIPQGKALSLDVSRMNRVLEVRPEDFLAVVEPGVTRKALNEALKGTGLFFPVDPGADASLGGMAATNASGTTTVRYGGMRQNVLALQVVLANGEVLELGRGVRKTSAGYDLKDLFIGSEGTLGIITRLTLRLHPIPEHIHTLRVFFENLTDTAQAAYAVMASGLPVARLELVDEIGIKAINRYLGRNYPEKPVLFVEFHSSTRASLEAESHLSLELMRELGKVVDDNGWFLPKDLTQRFDGAEEVYGVPQERVDEETLQRCGRRWRRIAPSDFPCESDLSLFSPVKGIGVSTDLLDTTVKTGGNLGRGERWIGEE